MTPAVFLTLVLLTGSVGWTLGVALPAPPVYLAGSMAAAVVVVEAFRRLDRLRGKLMAAGEVTAVLLVPVAGVALMPEAEAVTLFVGLGATLISWLLNQITASDLDGVVDPADSIESASTAPERLRTRFLWVGVAQSLAIVAGFGGLVPPLQARPLEDGFVISFLVYWLIGLAALSTVERRRRVARWNRDRTVIDGDLGSRWGLTRAILLATATLGAAVAIGLGAPALSALHGATTWISAGLTSLVTSLMGEADRENPPNQAPPQGGEVGEFTPTPDSTAPAPGEWLDLVLLVAFGLVFLGIYTLFTRRRVSTSVRPRASAWRQVLGILLELLKAIAALPAAIVRWWQHRRRGEIAGVQPTSHRSRPKPWNSSDPFRRRIATEFRSYLRTAETRDVKLWPHETPSEFGARLEAAGSPAVESLTHLYSVARYSDHPLREPDVNAARSARRQAESDLDQGPE